MITQRALQLLQRSIAIRKSTRGNTIEREGPSGADATPRLLPLAKGDPERVGAGGYAYLSWGRRRRPSAAAGEALAFSIPEPRAYRTSSYALPPSIIGSMSAAIALIGRTADTSPDFSSGRIFLGLIPPRI